MPPDDATERHLELLEALGSRILEGPGALPPQTRAAAVRDQDVPDPFGAFVQAIHRHAYRVTDRMVQGLAEAGASDDEVFEVSVAAAYGAARRRLEAGLNALRATRGGA